MATLASITGYIPQERTVIRRIKLGATVAAFKCVYADLADEGKFKEASPAADASSRAQAFLVTGGDDEDLADAIFEGSVELVGVANMLAAHGYILAASGNIRDEGDLASSEFATRVGRALSTSILDFDFKASGVAKA